MVFLVLVGVRDLIFHVQEHRFALTHIKNSLDELGLNFYGLKNEAVNSNFRMLHNKEVGIYDLTLWQQYEDDNPSAFAEMKHFFLSKALGQSYPPLA